MLKVIPIETKEEQQALCLQCHIPFRVDSLCYKATSEEIFAGLCQFQLDADGGHILDFVSVSEQEDFETLFVMGRAMMNFADLCHAKKMFFEAEYPRESMIKALGFEKVNQKWECNLEGFFNEPCKHHPMCNPDKKGD